MMLRNTLTQIILKAEEGHYLTNGETFAKVVVLPENADPSVWKEITELQYEIAQKDLEEREERNNV